MTDTCFTTDTFNKKSLNLVALGEVVLAFFVCELAAFRNLLGTDQLTGTQWLIALAPAVVLFLLLEAGKAIARHRSRPADEPVANTHAAKPAALAGASRAQPAGPPRGQ
jgi:hypothetical protein